jgi:hypothetical protein
MITKCGRVVIFNIFGEKLHEFFMSPSACAPLLLCNQTLHPTFQLKSNKGPTGRRPRNCVYLCKPSAGNQIVAHHIFRGESQYYAKAVAFRTLIVEQQSFSSPVTINDFVIFGARDNKLYVIKTE